MIRLVVTLFLSLTALTSVADNKVVYGEDNRLNLANVTNSLYAKLARSTAAMVELKYVETQGTSCSLAFGKTLETALNVCPSERFSQEPVGSMCSGFLVGEDTLVTAGHCLKLLGPAGYPDPKAVCKGFAWVFNYAVDKAGRNPLTGLTSNDVYRCKSVVTAKLTDTEDFAVIKLDRKVLGRTPLKYRTSGKIADRASLVVIGHPSGLPVKVSGGARVLINSDKNRFYANLDTFQGNSGSAVFDARTGQLEGILIQGKTDYRPNLATNPRSCQVVNTCDDSAIRCSLSTPGETLAEVITRITQLRSFIK